MHEGLIERAVASSATYRDSRCEKAKKESERKRKKREGGGGRGEEQKGQKGSPGIMATTLRSGLRAPKSRPVSMPGHRHSFERRMLCVLAVLRGSSGAPRLIVFARLVRSSLRDETLPAADSGDRAVPSVPVGRAYGCGTIGYLLLCIWHIVKLIERGDKIAMFFDVKRGERLARERDDGERRRRRRWRRREGERKTKGREPREGAGLTRGRRKEKERSAQRWREREGIARTREEERRALSGAASSPRRCL